MRTQFLKLCCAAFLLLAAPAFANEPSPMPKNFSASIGGFMGPSYQIELRNGVVTYTAFTSGHRDPKRATVTPTAEQWREFRQTLDDLKVWQWRAEYSDPKVLDGTQWSLDITYADRGLKTSGDNSYPDANGKPNGKPEPTNTFKRYLSAIQKLLGGKTFQ